MNAVRRLARVDEDEILSRILTNAFLPIWNHNWIQNIAHPVPSLPYIGALSTIQERRRKFYHALISLTRLAGGSVHVAEVNGDIVAILLWQDPNARPTFWHLFQSGFGRVALWDYGLRSLYRVQCIFEPNLNEIAQENKIEQNKYAYVQMLAVHPAHAGNGYAASLLQTTIDQHYQEHPQSPGVLLDCTTLSARGVYRRLGFKELGTRIIDTGCDVLGFAMSRSDPNYAAKRTESLRLHEQALMLLKH